MNFFVIIPTYNERANIKSMIETITTLMDDANILVVDDNSPDKTADVVRGIKESNPKVHLLLRAEKEGLGRAYLHAFSHLLKRHDPSHIAMIDCDFSHDPRYLIAMRARLPKGGVAIGSRYVEGGGTEGWEPWRKALSIYGNLYAQIITGMGVRDLTAGFYVIDCDVLRKIDLSNFNASGYAFQMELKNKLHRAGAEFLEVPIIFRNRREGESKMTGHIISEGLIAPWKIRFQK